MGAHVEPMANKEEILAEAESDQYRGCYIAFGGIHWMSVALGAISGAFAVQVVWHVTTHGLPF